MNKLILFVFTSIMSCSAVADNMWIGPQQRIGFNTPRATCGISIERDTGSTYFSKNMMSEGKPVKFTATNTYRPNNNNDRSQTTLRVIQVTHTSNFSEQTRFFLSNTNTDITDSNILTAGDEGTLFLKKYRWVNAFRGPKTLSYTLHNVYDVSEVQADADYTVTGVLQIECGSNN